LDRAYFDDLERNTAALLCRDLPTIERIVAGSCRIKAAIVERDEQEAELRHVLNYGHTVGHALEAATSFAHFTHGEAVSLGIAAEARVAEELRLARPETTKRQVELLRAMGLPVSGLGTTPAALVAALGRDKKARDGRVPFVLSPAIGEFKLVFDVPREVVLGALETLYS